MHLSRLFCAITYIGEPKTRIGRDPYIKYCVLSSARSPLLFFPLGTGSLLLRPFPGLFGICAELETFRRGLAKNFVRARKNFLQNF